MGSSKLVIGEGSDGSNSQSCSARFRMPDISVRFVLYSIFVQLYLQTYPIFVLLLDKNKISDRGVAAYTLSRHGVHIDRLKKNEKKCIITFSSLIKSV